MEKKILDKRRICELWSDNFQGNIESVIESLEETKKEHENAGWFNLYILIHHRYEDNVIELYGDRFETDAECEQRLKRSKAAKETAKKRKIKDKEKEYKEYLRLQKKFGKN